MVPEFNQVFCESRAHMRINRLEERQHQIENYIRRLEERISKNCIDVFEISHMAIRTYNNEAEDRYKLNKLIRKNKNIRLVPAESIKSNIKLKNLIMENVKENIKVNQIITKLSELKLR